MNDRLKKIFYLFFLSILINLVSASDIFEYFTNEDKTSTERTGDILQIALPLSALSSTFILKSKENRTQFWKSYISSISATYLLKYTINKKRPNGNSYSFPSGHTTSAFSGAMFIQKKYGCKYGVPSLILASFVGYSRVYANMHYWGDVFAGATIGILGNIIFTKNNEKVNISLVRNQGNPNLMVNLQF